MLSYSALASQLLRQFVDSPSLEVFKNRTKYPSVQNGFDVVPLIRRNRLDFLSRFVSGLSALKWITLLFGGGKVGCKVTLYEFIDASRYTSWWNKIHYIPLVLLVSLKHLVHLEPPSNPVRWMGPFSGCLCHRGVGKASRCWLVGPESQSAWCRAGMPFLAVGSSGSRAYLLTLVLLCVFGVCFVIRCTDIWFGANFSFFF